MVQQNTDPLKVAPIEMVAVVPAVTEDVTVQEPDADLEELSACIEAGVVRMKKRGKIVRQGVELYNIPWGIAGVWAGMHGMAMLEQYIIWLVIKFWVKQAVLKAISSRWVRRFRPTERAAIQRIIGRDDIRGVGSMIDTLRWTDDAKLTTQLWSALGRLLPQLSEEQDQKLGLKRHGELVAWMKVWETRSHEFGNVPLLGMLHTMACVGQTSMKTEDRSGVIRSLTLFPMLNKWIAGRGAGQDLPVQEAVIACRNAIYQKMAIARSGKQLLRASGPVSAGAETMLRPAQGVPQTNPQELLRPDGSEQT